MNAVLPLFQNTKLSSEFEYRAPSAEAARGSVNSLPSDNVSLTESLSKAAEMDRDDGHVNTAVIVLAEFAAAVSCGNDLEYM